MNLRTGKAGETTPTRTRGALAVAEGRVYGRFDDIGDTGPDWNAESGLLPIGVHAANPRTLDGTTVPLPSAALSLFWGPSPISESRIVLEGGRAYVASATRGGGIRLAAYAPGPAGSPDALGGVPPRDWPDACELGRGLDDARTRTPHRLKTTAGTIPRWGCDHDFERNGRVTVWTAWTAPDAEEAGRMLDPAEAFGGAAPVPGVGDEAYRFMPPSQGSAFMVIRTGRYVVVVKSLIAGDPKPMAERVAKNLERAS